MEGQAADGQLEESTPKQADASRAATLAATLPKHAARKRKEEKNSRKTE